MVFTAALGFTAAAVRGCVVATDGALLGAAAVGVGVGVAVPVGVGVALTAGELSPAAGDFRCRNQRYR